MRHQLYHQKRPTIQDSQPYTYFGVQRMSYSLKGAPQQSLLRFTHQGKYTTFAYVNLRQELMIVKTYSSI